MRRRSTSASYLPGLVLLAISSVFTSYGQEAADAREVEEEVCPDCECPPVAIKSNLLYDAAITPDLGIEISLSKKISIGMEGVYAWWSNDRKHRYWRIRGGWLDASWWFGNRARQQRLIGHHAGIYLSLHDFDFEFGNKGWQARNPVFGAGLTYGYSFRLSDRLSLDLHLRIGYAGGRVKKYIPQCGAYNSIREYHSNYWGLTGVGVSLVWFPGRGNSNNPSR